MSSHSTPHILLSDHAKKRQSYAYYETGCIAQLRSHQGCMLCVFHLTKQVIEHEQTRIESKLKEVIEQLACIEQ